MISFCNVTVEKFQPTPLCKILFIQTHWQIFNNEGLVSCPIPLSVLGSSQNFESVMPKHSFTSCAATWNWFHPLNHCFAA